METECESLCGLLIEMKKRNAGKAGKQGKDRAEKRRDWLYDKENFKKKG